MENRRGLLRLHNLSIAYNQRPSQIAGLADEWTAYQFDAACLIVGRLVERALTENRAKKKRERLPEEEIIRRTLGEDILTVNASVQNLD